MSNIKKKCDGCDWNRVFPYRVPKSKEQEDKCRQCLTSGEKTNWKRVKLVDCIFYKENDGNCWDSDGWDSNFCNFPDAGYPLCNGLCNGWHGKTFKKKIEKRVMDSALEKYILQENGTPTTLMRRLKGLEETVEKLLSQN